MYYEYAAAWPLNDDYDIRQQIWDDKSCCPKTITQQRRREQDFPALGISEIFFTKRTFSGRLSESFLPLQKKMR